MTDNRKKAAYERYRSKSKIGGRLPSYEVFQAEFASLEPFEDIGKPRGLNREMTSILFEKFFSGVHVPNGRTRQRLRTLEHHKEKLDRLWQNWETRFSDVFREAQGHGLIAEPLMRNGRPSMLFFWLNGKLAQFASVQRYQDHYRAEFKLEKADLLVVQTKQGETRGFYLFPAHILVGRKRVYIPVDPQSWYHKHIRGLDPRRFKDCWNLAMDSQLSETG